MMAMSLKKWVTPLLIRLIKRGLGTEYSSNILSSSRIKECKRQINILDIRHSSLWCIYQARLVLDLIELGQKYKKFCLFTELQGLPSKSVTI